MSRMRLVLIIVAGVFAAGAMCSLAQQALESPRVQLAETENLSLSVNGSLGFINGKAHEIVYEYCPDGSRYKTSELIWDLKNVLMGGGGISIAIVNRVHINAGYWAPLSKGNGQMEDYDWLLYEPNTPWTDWSLSDVSVVKGHVWDVNASVDLLRMQSFSVRGFAGYKENFWRWEDAGVRHRYSSDPFVPGGFRDDIGDDGCVNGINYEQEFKIPYFGAGVDWAHRGFTLAACLSYSPFVMAEDKDNHLLRNIEFVESFDGGTFFGAGLSASYLFDIGIFAEISVDHQEVSEIIGDSTMTELDTSESMTSKSGAGIDNSLTQFSVSLGYLF